MTLDNLNSIAELYYIILYGNAYELLDYKWKQANYYGSSNMDNNYISMDYLESSKEGKVIKELYKYNSFPR